MENNPSYKRILRSHVFDLLFPRPVAGLDVSEAFLRYDEELGRYVYVTVDDGTSVIVGGIVEACSICLEAVGERQGVVGRCEHTFHQDCIMEWLEEDHDHCPNCRQPMWDPASYAAMEQTCRAELPPSVYHNQGTTRTSDNTPYRVENHNSRSSEPQTNEFSLAEQNNNNVECSVVNLLMVFLGTGLVLAIFRLTTSFFNFNW